MPDVKLVAYKQPKPIVPRPEKSSIKSSGSTIQEEGGAEISKSGEDRGLDPDLMNIYHQYEMKLNRSTAHRESLGFNNISKIVDVNRFSPDKKVTQSMLNLPTLNNVRRIHNDGVVFLDNHYNMKEIELKAQFMENRLKKLRDQEAKAQKSRLLAEKKAQQLLEARGRHYDDMIEKIKQYQS